MSSSPTATISLPHTAHRGLSSADVALRVQNGQVNRVSAQTSRSVGEIVRSNVFTLFNGIIAAAMVMVLATGSWKDAVFGFVIIINTGIGIITELRAKCTLDKLSILVASNFMARRDGEDVSIRHDEIVLGDLLWVRSGDQVPADAQIVETWGLELDESMLTGESRTVRKAEGDQIYSGSVAVSGLALVRVNAVGEHSYAATLTAQAKVYKKTVSDLTAGINTILRFMTVVVVPLCVLLIWSQIRSVGGWNHAIDTGAWRDAVVSAVAGVVGMIPEGLVLLTSLNFALAAMRLARRNTLVQELESVETLARVDCLNLDKTGTITDGGIAYDRLIMVHDAMAHGAASHDSAAAARHAPAGEVSEQAAIQALFDCCNEENPNGTAQAVLAGLGERGCVAGSVSGRIPFSSARKWSAIAYDATASTGDDATAANPPAGIWMMGAPEVLLSALDCDGGELLDQVNGYALDGNRVLLLAYAPDGALRPEEPHIDPHAIPVALVLCSEHIRPDAEKTLAWFREQGVRARIISGDNPVTVGAIAHKVKLTGDREPVAMDARDLPDDINEMARTLENVDVLGRVLPDQKKAIVQALHVQGHVVAMTGDGVNDALAIKEADLGIAMGNAASATKAVAQVVLVDSKFSHLPEVVARGRQVMANMERVASLFLVKTVYSALISLGVVLTQVPYPYLPRHITYIGALTIGIPAFVLALAPNTRRYQPGFLKRVVHFALPGGVAVAVSVLMAAWTLPGIMGWKVETSDADLMSLRATCAIILFMLGVFVLARVARPLNGWRGVLVLLFAAAGVIGAMIPVVRNFFALVIPTGQMLVATSIALAGSVAVFFLCLLIVPLCWRIIAYANATRQH